MVDDSLITAECDNGYAYNEARGNSPGVRLAERKQIWNETDGILLTNCYDFVKDGDKIRYLLYFLNNSSFSNCHFF